MKARRYILLGSSVLGAVVIQWTTKSYAWTIASVASILLLAHLWERKKFVRWSRSPRKSPHHALGYYLPTAQKLHSSLQSSRIRSESLLNLAKRYRNAANNIPDAWVLLDGSMTIEAVNQTATSMLGLSHSDIGQPLVALIRNPEVWGLLNDTDEVDVVELASPIDEQHRLELRLVRVSDQQNIVIARDVTELNRWLSMRRDFVANVSHELRSPLTVFMGYLESIEDEQLDTETIRELVSRLNTPAQRMKSLVDDLLTLTRLEASPEPELEALSNVDGSKLINSVIQEVAPLKSDIHKIHLHANDNLMVQAVADELHSVFMNLLINAIRYSPDGGNISLRWHGHNAHARFEIEDEGIGMSAENIPRITERFYRIDPASSRTKGGTGLGLAIVKHVLRRHHAILEVESKIGIGSKFCFNFPLKFESRVSNVEIFDT